MQRLARELKGAGVRETSSRLISLARRSLAKHSTPLAVCCRGFLEEMLIFKRRWRLFTQTHMGGRDQRGARSLRGMQPVSTSCHRTKK